MEIIYDRHDEEWTKCIEDKEKKKIAETWLKDNTLDKWRHERMLKVIKPLINGKNKWLTIGDGRYGTDANFILKNGDQAVASDISDKLLKIGNQIGFINNFSEQNAENLSFKDESFDYVLIKEAFHHLPRPWVGLYEAFRVSRKGVILIEPNDTNSKTNGIRKKILKTLKLILKIVLKRKSYYSGYNFESVGNFIYSTSERELEKFLLGMHYTNIAFKSMSDFYINGIEHVSLNSSKISDIIRVQTIKKTIFMREFLNKIGFEDNPILCTILFKQEPDKNTLQELKKFKWDVKKLPSNPFLKKN